MKKAKDFRDLSLDELDNAYHDACKKLYVCRNQQKSQKKFDKPHEIRHARKEIARILTVQTEKRNQMTIQSS